MVFISKLKIVIDLRHMDFTSRVINQEAEETRKPCFFLPFVTLNKFLNLKKILKLAHVIWMQRTVVQKFKSSFS